MVNVVPTTTEIRIISGIPRHEIMEYFAALSGWEHSQNDQSAIYSYGEEGIQVSITPLPAKGQRTLYIPKTELIFTGRTPTIERVVQNYRKKFLRGGG